MMELWMLRFLLCLCLGLGIGTMADEPPVFGEIDPSDLSMTDYAPEPGAAAVILNDYGKAGLNVTGRLELVRHVRVKILKPEGLSQATVSLPFRYYQETKEKIRYLAAASYRLEDDRVVQRELAGETVTEEPLDLEHRRLQFTVPGARVGSVIEYKYQLLTNTLWFPNWNFQHDLPVRTSEFTAVFPDIFKYRMVFGGAAAYDDVSVDNVKIPLTLEQALSDKNWFEVRDRTRYKNFQLHGRAHRWVMRGVPSLNAEPHGAPVENHRRKIRFQLSGLWLPDEAPYPVVAGWTDLRTKLLDAGHLGGQLRRDKRRVSAQAKAWMGETRDPLTIMNNLYGQLVNHVAWDGQRGIRADRNLGEVLKSGRGNVAETALCLVALLRAAGIEAHPVLLGSREYGTVQATQPMKEQFNYVLAMAEIDGTTYLLDPTDPLRPAERLSLSALNGKMWVIGDEAGTWLESPEYTDTTRITFTGSLDQHGKLDGAVSYNEDGYGALAQRHAHQAKPVDGRSQLSLEAPVTIIQQRADALDEPSLPLKRRLAFEAQLAATNGVLKLKPMVTRTGLPLFEDQQRNLPIDFIYRRHWSYTASILLPEGVTAEIIPKPISLAPVPGLSFKRVVAINGNQLSMRATLMIDRIHFEKESYPGLQQFFQIVDQALDEALTVDGFR